MSEHPPRFDDRQITFGDFLRAVWRYKWLLAALFVVSVGVAWVLTARQPKIYEAMTTLLIQKDGGSGFLATLTTLGAAGPAGGGGSGPALPGLAIPSATPNRDVVVSILKSRRVADAAVRKFDLQARYGKAHHLDAVDGLRGLVSVTINRDGVVEIRVEETDPKLAADIANFHVEELDRLVKQFGLVEASRQRAFVADQLAAARTGLAASEEALRRFQERNRAVVLQDQTRGAIEAAARLKGEMVATEVRLQVMRDFATERDPEVIVLRRRVEEMKRHLASMQYGNLPPGDGVARDSRDGDIYLPFSRVPAIGLDLARLTRDFKIQETIVMLLIQQLEQAKISESKDPPLARVLDGAEVPVHHIRPRLRYNLLAAGVGALFLGVLLACTLEYMRIQRRVPAA